MTDKLEIIVTADGSQSLRVPDLEETYPSRKGAAQESSYVFIKQGLEEVYGSKIRVFEVGFGTGLNTILTLEYARQKSMQIEYTAIEKYPVGLEIIRDFSRDWLELRCLRDDFLNMHDLGWGTWNTINITFLIRKVEEDWMNYEFDSHYDLIYYDAFAPSRQSEMWEIELLQKCHDALVNEGLLVTYCAQGQFRRNLEAVGFTVERIPGPPGKREMIRARKIR